MIPDWTPIDYFRIPNNTLCFPLPPASWILRKLLFSKWYSWKYAVLTGAFENSPSRPSWRETLKFLWFLFNVSFSHMWKNTVRNSTGCVILLTCEKHRSLLWLARTHLYMKIYDTAFHWVYLEYTYDKREWRLRRNDTLFSTSQSYWWRELPLLRHLCMTTHLHSLHCMTQELPSILIRERKQIIQGC